MRIDAPCREDIPRLRHLWQEAFGDDEVFLDSFFETAFSYGRCRCVFMGSYLAAALYWLDCQWEEKKVAYIYAVATDKAYRGQGLCRQLMEDTHKHLLKNGYTGAALVPGNEGLFALYKKIGYRPFCPMDKTEISAGGTPVCLNKLSAEEFGQKRRKRLPKGGILQEGVTLSYLDRFTEFFEADGSLMCLSREADVAYFQEYLGDKNLLPGILAALGVQKGILRLPGSKDSAMYYSPQPETPSYLGLSLG